MLTLNHEVLKGLEKPLPSSQYPERVLQIGEGNFLRGFIDWMIFEMNKAGHFQGSVVAIQPTPRGKVVPKLNRQDGLYTTVLRGIENGEPVETIEVIDSIRRGINPYSDWADALKVSESAEIEFVFSNTTEAGLQYLEEDFAEDSSPLSFPGKLVSLLYHRFEFYKGDVTKGWIILPCELVEKNGEVLKGICKRLAEYWELPESFWNWVEESCVFCNTLVDRIVTGFPHEEAAQFEERLGYQDVLLTVAEPYHLFVIEGPEFIEEKLPFKKAGLNVHFDHIDSYRELKVKFLNAPHTMLAAVGVLSGIETVREGIEDSLIYSFINEALTVEIAEVLGEKEKAKSAQYIKDVYDRFLNPYLHHKLLDISLNSYAKFQTRVLPSLLKFYQTHGVYPKRLVFSLAALLNFYRMEEEDGEKSFGQGLGGSYEIRDGKEVIEKFRAFWGEYNGQREQTVKLISEMILEDIVEDKQLYNLTSLAEEIADDVMLIREKGMRTALEQI
ncbi:tagaturonate reductase [Bacillus dakarensis]|uniref:tagaturonate reductase n=1 Tax=Robertmurraya dakarensis TaxID=1926278 RepID=UPI0009823E59|nr:tagaturonate reductase [Bacillus dakarensis]